MENYDDIPNIFDIPLFIVVSVALLSVLSIAIPNFLIFGFVSFNNQTVSNAIEYKISFGIVCVFSIIYISLLIFLFYSRNDVRKSYISIMKRFKIYNGNYRVSHLITMLKLLVTVILTLILSIIIGNALFLLSKGYVDKNIKSYKLFLLGFMFISINIICGLASLELRWIYEKRDELLPEVDL